jgi:hypothetical protein
VKFSRWPEIGLDADVLLTPYVPNRITGYDDDDDTFETHHVVLGITGLGANGTTELRQWMTGHVGALPRISIDLLIGILIRGATCLLSKGRRVGCRVSSN